MKSTTTQGQIIESNFIRALSAPRLAKISESDLKALMLFIYTLVGLKGENYPKGLDKDFLHSYVMDYYSGHTVDEIRLAFTMAIQGKLSLDPADVKVYENFNVSYFTRIMEAYRSWAREEYQKVPEKRIEYKPPRHQIELEFALYKLKTIDKLPCRILSQVGQTAL